MAEQMNIYQKLARIRKQVEVIQKNKSGYGYKYVSEDSTPVSTSARTITALLALTIAQYAVSLSLIHTSALLGISSHQGLTPKTVSVSLTQDSGTAMRRL